jgi:hypothetical protein
MSELLAGLERARRRVVYCRRELDSFLAYANLDSEEHQRVIRKLQRDLDMAELDASWVAHKLDQAQVAPAPIVDAAGVTDA